MPEFAVFRAGIARGSWLRSPPLLRLPPDSSEDSHVCFVSWFVFWPELLGETHPCVRLAVDERQRESAGVES